MTKKKLNKTALALKIFSRLFFTLALLVLVIAFALTFQVNFLSTRSSGFDGLSLKSFGYVYMALPYVFIFLIFGYICRINAKHLSKKS